MGWAWWVKGDGLRVMGWGWWVEGDGLRLMSWGWWVVGDELRVMGWGWWVACDGLTSDNLRIWFLGGRFSSWLDKLSPVKWFKERSEARVTSQLDKRNLSFSTCVQNTSVGPWYTLHFCMFDTWMKSEYMIGSVTGSNICVQLHTRVHGSVCDWDRIGARRWQIKLEQIRRGWSKTMVRKHFCSGIEQSRRTENRFVCLRSEKSSKFWKLKTKTWLQTSQ